MKFMQIEVTLTYLYTCIDEYTSESLCYMCMGVCNSLRTAVTLTSETSQLSVYPTAAMRM